MLSIIIMFEVVATKTNDFYNPTIVPKYGTNKTRGIINCLCTVFYDSIGVLSKHTFSINSYFVVRGSKCKKNFSLILMLKPH